jgi:hypothetical protein
MVAGRVGSERVKIIEQRPCGTIAIPGGFGGALGIGSRWSLAGSMWLKWQLSVKTGNLFIRRTSDRLVVPDAFAEFL